MTTETKTQLPISTIALGYLFQVNIVASLISYFLVNFLIHALPNSPEIIQQLLKVLLHSLALFVSIMYSAPALHKKYPLISGNEIAKKGVKYMITLTVAGLGLLFFFYSTLAIKGSSSLLQETLVGSGGVMDIVFVVISSIIALPVFYFATVKYLQPPSPGEKR